MKNILFVIPELSHGGTNKSLENLLSLIDKQRFCISIFCLTPFFGSEIYYPVFKSYLLQESKIFRLCKNTVCIRKLLNLLSNKFHIQVWTYLLKREMKRLQTMKNFDFAIAFQEGPATWFASYFDGRKIAWLHCDYELYQEYSNFLDEFDYYSLFEKVVCVSNYTKKTFIKHYPDMNEKTICIYNSLNENEMLSKSKDDIVDRFFDDNSFKIVSVGRIIEVKQFYKIPSIINKMLTIDNTISFKWYIIGSGDNQFELDVKNQIKRYNVESKIAMLGQKANPYPYIKKADLLVCTSRTEACPYVINEAKVLHTPIVTTNYPSSVEMLDSENGIITTIEKMPEILINIIQNKNNIYTNMKLKSLCYKYNNESIIGSFYSLLD